MDGNSAAKKVIIRYWERRRIVFNAALILPALLGYAMGGAIPAAVGDIRRLDTMDVCFLFLISAVGANLCYSFGYALEFFLGTDNPDSRWIKFWRPLCMVLGTLFSMFLALVWGRNIAWMEYSFR